MISAGIPIQIKMSLPVLNSHFLVLHPPTMELLQNPGPWTADFFPIYQWDGILFIGVSHPDHVPADFIPSEKCVIVQSEVEALQATWKQLQLSSHNEILNITAQNPIAAMAAIEPEAPAVFETVVPEIAEAQPVVLSTKIPPPHPIIQPKSLTPAIPAVTTVVAAAEKIIPQKPIVATPPPHPVLTAKVDEVIVQAPVVEAPKVILEAKPEVKVEAKVEAKPEPNIEAKPEIKLEIKPEPQVTVASASAAVKEEAKPEAHSLQITPQINLTAAVEELILLDVSENSEAKTSAESAEHSGENQMPEGFMSGSEDAASSPAQILQTTELGAELTPEEVASADVSTVLSLAPVKTLMAKAPEEEVTSFANIAMSATATTTFDESETPQVVDQAEELPESIAAMIEIEENTKIPLHAVAETAAQVMEPAKPAATVVTPPAPQVALAEEPKTSTSIRIAQAAAIAAAAPMQEPDEVTVMMTSQALKETSTDNWVNDYLSKLNAHFKKSMLMILNGEKLHAWRWNEGYTPASKKTPTYNINTKSPFYVVAKTLKSYHGKVPMVGEIVEFNKFWSKDAEMGLFTVAPLIINGKLLGALITEGENDSIDLDKLDFTEKIAAEISQTLLSNPELLKAA